MQKKWPRLLIMLPFILFMAVFAFGFNSSQALAGQTLDVSGASTANGANVDQWLDSGTANQQWDIVQV